MYYGVALSAPAAGGNMYLNFFLSSVIEIPAIYVGIKAYDKCVFNIESMCYTVTQHWLVMEGGERDRVTSLWSWEELQKIWRPSSRMLDIRQTIILHYSSGLATGPCYCSESVVHRLAIRLRRLNLNGLGTCFYIVKGFLYVLLNLYFAFFFVAGLDGNCPWLSRWLRPRFAPLVPFWSENTRELGKVTNALASTTNYGMFSNLKRVVELQR